MATAKNFSLTFLGASGRTYQVSGYTADTAGYINTFSQSAAAASGGTQYVKLPERASLIDFAIPTGTTQTNMVMTENGAVRNGTLLNFATFLDTIANRPRLSIPFEANSLIGSNTI